MNNALSTETVVSPIEVAEIRTSEYQKPGTMTAILKQEVTTTSVYPGKKFSNELADNLFDNSDFGDEGKTYEKTEKRVAFMLVPTGTTIEQIQEKLAKAPKACIYKILDTKPIVSNDQHYAISVGQTTLEAIADKQRVINPETGEVILFYGQEQYRATFFSTTGQADIDNRKVVSIVAEKAPSFELQSSSFDRAE